MAEKPSREEDDYFARQEYEKLRDLANRKKEGMAEDDEVAQKELHWMHCPKCGLELQEVEFRGVQVDTSFACKGMFLDGGEVEKILAHEEPGMLERIAQSLFKPISGS